MGQKFLFDEISKQTLAIENHTSYPMADCTVMKLYGPAKRRACFPCVPGIIALTRVGEADFGYSVGV
jgi:hypothetical protein